MDQRRLAGLRQAMSVMIACAWTWSIGGMTNVFEAGEVYDVPPNETRKVEADTPYRIVNASYRKVHFIGQEQLTLKNMFLAT